MLADLEYIRFLSVKRADYDAKAILEFDADFLRYARHEKCSLNDSVARSACSDHHFSCRQLHSERKSICEVTAAYSLQHSKSFRRRSKQWPAQGFLLGL